MLTAPSLGYSLLAPMLIVLAGAVIGVLVEAFVGKARRTAIQVTLSIGVLLLSLQQLWRIKDLSSTTAAVGSVTIDKAGIFLQATIILLSLAAVLLIADQDNFVAQASALPGSPEERTALQDKSAQTEIFPLFLFAVSGMMLFTVATIEIVSDSVTISSVLGLRRTISGAIQGITFGFIITTVVAAETPHVFVALIWIEFAPSIN